MTTRTDLLKQPGAWELTDNGNNRKVSTRKKRTEAQREADMAMIAKLLLRENLTQQEMADRLGKERNYSVSSVQIHYDIRELMKRWRDAYLEDTDILKGRELRRIDELETAYWKSYERSLRGTDSFIENLTENSTEEDGQGMVENSENTDTQSEKTHKKRIRRYSSRKFQNERDGEVKFLNGIQWCINKRCEILGLNAPIRAEMTLDWRKEAEKAGIDPTLMYNEAVKKFVDGHMVDSEEDDNTTVTKELPADVSHK